MRKIYNSQKNFFLLQDIWKSPEKELRFINWNRRYHWIERILNNGFYWKRKGDSDNFSSLKFFFPIMNFFSKKIFLHEKKNETLHLYKFEMIYVKSFFLSFIFLFTQMWCKNRFLSHFSVIFHSNFSVFLFLIKTDNWQINEDYLFNNKKSIY